MPPKEAFRDYRRELDMATGEALVAWRDGEIWIVDAMNGRLQRFTDAGVFVGVGTAGSFRNLAREALRGSAQGVATTTRIAYLNVLLAQEAVRVTQNSIERVRQTLEETRALMERLPVPTAEEAELLTKHEDRIRETLREDVE